MIRVLPSPQSMWCELTACSNLTPGVTLGQWDNGECDTRKYSRVSWLWPLILLLSITVERTCTVHLTNLWERWGTCGTDPVNKHMSSLGQNTDTKLSQAKPCRAHPSQCHPHWWARRKYLLFHAIEFWGDLLHDMRSAADTHMNLRASCFL